MRKVAVVGIGMTKFGVAEKTAMELFAEAAADAIDDAGITTKDIEALFFSNVLGFFSEGMGNPAPFAAAELGLQDIPSTRFEGACATGSVAIRDAYMWVASGFYDVVLVAGTERVCNMGTPFATRTFAMGHDSYYEQFTGLTFPGVFAMIAHLYSKKYGIPLQKLKEQMALVAVKNHANALLNPKAHFHKKITVEDVLNSVMICDPLQLYDCCPFSDGAAAIILASEEKAKKMTDTPIYIAGAGQSSAGPLFRQKDITITQARITSSRMAYKQAKVEPKDIDIVELHDCFTIAEMVATEALGFFNFGEGGKAVEEGRTRIDGDIPINPSGGLKAKGHPVGATGIAQAAEIVLQLRGEADKRQVKDAEIGLTHNIGGSGASCVVHIMEVV